MCGIAGFAATPSLGVDAIGSVQRMCKRMRTRGPDAEGVWADASGSIVFGHRRLAIIDTEPRSNQPMLSTDGRLAIIYNGEIYNFRELRSELEDVGDIFLTTSDTEVLLCLYRREGTKMLRRLRGMFAFAVWDSSDDSLFLARDPYGIKPLYYATIKDGFLFASQVKAMLASGLVSREPETAGLAGFYLWGSVPEPWTIYRDIRALKAGHWMRVRRGVPNTPVCWHDIRIHWQGECRVDSARDLQVRVREAVTDSVRAHLVADVPVSVFLSAGIDSSAVAGLAAGLGAKVEGITIGFEEFAGRNDDEAPEAQAIAAQYGLPHHVHIVTREEFEADLPLILSAMDQPSIDGVNTWFASKAAAERGYKVVLSGVGGDELFCGYPSFRQIPQLAAAGRWIGAQPLRPVLRALFTWLARRLHRPKLANLPDFCGGAEAIYFLRRGLFLPNELPDLMGADAASDGLQRLGFPLPNGQNAEARNGIARVGLMESTQYLRNQLLRDSDWASMGHCVELRTPLVDARLLETLGPHIHGFTRKRGKAMLARSPQNPLPDNIISRCKTGFGVPMAQWLARDKKVQPWRALPMLAAPGTPWARRWAYSVITQYRGDVA